MERQQWAATNGRKSLENDYCFVKIVLMNKSYY